MGRQPMMIAIAAVALIAPAHARECASAKPHGDHRWWSYRIVDHRACWYEGRHRMGKSRLAWFSAPGAPLAVQLVPLPRARPADTFDDRWKASRPPAPGSQSGEVRGKP